MKTNTRSWLQRRPVRWVALVCTAAACSALGTAPAAAVDTTSTPVVVDDDTAEFLGKAATEAAALVEGAQLAQQRTSVKEVRQFATDSSKQLQKLQTELNSVAGRVGASTSIAADMEEKREILDDVREEKDEDFEQAYIETVVNTLEDMIGRFNEAREDAESMEIRNFAQTHYTALSQLHERAQELDGRLDELTES